MASASYGWAQPTVRRLCELDQSNIRFCLEPDRATRHYVALCVRGWVRAAGTLGGVEWLAERIAKRNRRNLLREIWGVDLGPANLLSRCHGGVWPAVRYDQLALVLADEVRRAAMARLPRLRSKEAIILAEAPIGLVRLAVMRVALTQGVPVINYVATGIHRRADPLTDREVLTRLSRVKRYSDFATVIYDMLVDCPLPDPPWPGTQTIRPVRTLREVRQAGDRFQNCLRDPSYALPVSAGDLAIYIVESSKEPVCASLKYDRVLRSWRLNEIKGLRNGRPSPRLSRSIRDAFAAAGFPYLPVSPLGHWFDQ